MQLKDIDQLSFVSLMLKLFICLGPVLLKWVLYRLAWHLTRLFDPGRKEAHKVFVSDKFAILIDNCNRYDVIVSVYLVHQSAHHTESILRLDDLFLPFVFDRSNIKRHFTLVKQCLERPCHKQIRVSSLTVVDNKSLLFLLDLVPYLLHKLFIQNFVNQYFDNKLPKQVPTFF